MMKFRSLIAAAALAVALFTSHAEAQVSQPASGQVVANCTAAQARATPCNLTALIDRALGSTRGAILERGLSGWGIVAPSATAGLAYGSNGTGSDPSYQIVPVVGGGTGANTASGARTNLGLAIGTNVEAWNTNLDCLAALATTGVVHRTGSGTCSAAAVALTDLAAGTSDMVIGYFGSTVASANAIPNCTGALVYSTSTHLFTCNATAGTGTVTSAQIIGAGITVNSGTCTITSTGACTLTTPAAVKSDMITATSTTLAVTPGEVSFSPYAMKVHGLLVISGGTTATLQPGSAGISSVAYTSTGQYKVNFTTSFANTTYDCTTSATGGSTSAFLAVPGQTSYTASQVSITVLQATAFGVADPSAVSIQCAGLQ